MSLKNAAALTVILFVLWGLALPAHSQSPFGMQYPGMQYPGMQYPGMQYPFQMPFSGGGDHGSDSHSGIGMSRLPSDVDITRGLDTNLKPGTTTYYDTKYRIAVIKNSLTYQKKMNSGRVAFGRQMENQYFNTKFWEPMTINGNTFWKIKDGVGKADAFNDFISPMGGKYKIDCAAAINIIMLKAKLDVAGEDNFCRLLPDIMVRGWTTYTSKDGKLKEYKTLERWTGNQYIPGSPEGLLTGDYVYFKNHPMMEGTPEQGENAIYLGKDDSGRPVFFGLNIGIFKGVFNEYGILSSEKGRIDPATLKAMAEGRE
jgi:protein-glutamine gamma-glutamyltransferase